MSRYAILTVGKTHSGKTTFARLLDKELPGAVVMDQDNNAAFINEFYEKLQPKTGPNTFKHRISLAIVDYAINETDLHLIICNANRSKRARQELIRYFKDNGLRVILIHFDLPDSVLEKRIARTDRSTSIFRSAAAFEEVLARQQIDSLSGDTAPPSSNEAHRLFTIHSEADVPFVIKEIVRCLA